MRLYLVYWNRSHKINLISTGDNLAEPFIKELLAAYKKVLGHKKV